MRIACLLAALLTFPLTTGCGDDAPPPPDSGIDSGVEDATPGDADPGDADPGDADPGDADPGDADPGDAGRPDAVVDSGPLGPCTEDGAACEGGFCRPTEAGGLECHPWRMDGDTCGGFTRAWEQERCDPSLRCINYRPRLPDAQGVCGIVATADEVIATPGDYVGRTTGILSVYLHGGVARCTRRGCPERDPCCNTCGSTMRLRDDMGMLLFRASPLSPIECSGHAGRPEAMCNAYEMCTDLIEANRNHVIVGSVVRAAEGDRFVFTHGPFPVAL